VVLTSDRGFITVSRSTYILDIQSMQVDESHKDLNILLKERNISVHKVILSTASASIKELLKKQYAS